mmetsp:Transcript_19525/g.63443  ORF Transcript_19525/g.63443 Transcript_19525/m.63443 type:complete len:212 (+) Transcript_19525:61-696(+)
MICNFSSHWRKSSSPGQRYWTDPCSGMGVLAPGGCWRLFQSPSARMWCEYTLGWKQSSADNSVGSSDWILLANGCARTVNPGNCLASHSNAMRSNTSLYATAIRSTAARFPSNTHDASLMSDWTSRQPGLATMNACGAVRLGISARLTKRFGMRSCSACKSARMCSSTNSGLVFSGVGSMQASIALSAPKSTVASFHASSGTPSALSCSTR